MSWWTAQPRRFVSPSNGAEVPEMVVEQFLAGTRSPEGVRPQAGKQRQGPHCRYPGPPRLRGTRQGGCAKFDATAPLPIYSVLDPIRARAISCCSYRMDLCCQSSALSWGLAPSRKNARSGRGRCLATFRSRSRSVHSVRATRCHEVTLEATLAVTKPAETGLPDASTRAISQGRSKICVGSTNPEAQLFGVARQLAQHLPDPRLVVSVSTIHDHLALLDRPPRLRNSRFVSFRWKVEMKLGVELELRALRRCPATNPRPAARPRKKRVATQLSAASTREP